MSLASTTLSSLTQGAALLKARGACAAASRATSSDDPPTADVLAAVEVLTSLSELSRRAESALSAAAYGRAYEFCRAFDAALAAAGASAPARSFLQPITERVVRVSAKALQQLSDSLGRVCYVFDAVRYAEVLQAFGSLESAESLNARVVAAYEGAVLASVREFGAAAKCLAFEEAFRGLLTKLATVAGSLNAAITWHENGGGDGSSVICALRHHVAGSRAQLCRAIVQSVVRVLESSPPALKRPVTARSLVGVYEMTTKFNAILEAFLRLSNASLESIENDARAAACQIPKQLTTESLDGIPEVGVNLHFAPRRGRVAESGHRFEKPFKKVGAGPLLRVLNKWTGRQWGLLQGERMKEARLLLADAPWIRAGLSLDEITLLQDRSKASCAVGSVSVSLQEARDALSIVSGPVGDTDWMRIGVADVLEGSEGCCDSSLEANEVTLTLAVRGLVQLAADDHLLCSARIPELRTRCCRDAIELFWLVLRAAFELLPPDESRKSFSDVLSTSSMVRQRQLDAMTEHLPNALRSQMTTLLAPSLESSSIVSSQNLTASCVAVECLLTMKALLGPWLMTLCEASDTSNAALDTRFLRMAFALCDSFAETSYKVCVSSLVYGDLSIACLTNQLWGKCEPGCFPTQVSPYVVDFLQRCGVVLRQRPALPPESSHKLCVALCEAATSSLLDGLSTLPTSSVSFRMQMLLDARHLETELEERTGLRPVPGARRLKECIQAWFLPPEELQSWIDRKQRRLQLSEAHVEALSRQSSSDSRTLAASGSAVGILLSRAHSDFLGSFRSLLSVTREDARATFTIGDGAEE